MRAAVIETSTSEPILTDYTDPPSPSDAQMSIRMTAAALNPIDLQIAAGIHPLGVPRYPYVPGVEGVGVVEAGDPSLIGRRVRVQVAGGFVGGTLAQRVLADASACAPIPDSLPDSLAAAIGVVGVSAYLALEKIGFRAGQSVLVAGANGPFGRAFLQCARILGASRVVAAARSTESLAGADVDGTIDLKSEDLASQLRVLGGPMDVVVDPLWGPYPHTLLGCLAPSGHYLSVGSAAGATTDITASRLRGNHLSITGFTGTTSAIEQVTHTYEIIARFAANGQFDLPLQTHGLASVQQAWIGQRRPNGHKIVVEIDH
ncbi:MAG: quinone oxidoreductase family protein [Mycobacterium sp.]|jgi:NADPH:quinone reductase-like Zn-dependent oxidoreductase